MSETDLESNTIFSRVTGEFFRKAFESTTAALAILDAQTLRVREANQSFFDLFGGSADTLLNHSLADWPLTTTQDARLQFEDKLRAGGPLRNQEIEFRRPGGDNRMVLWSVDSIRIGRSTSLLLTLVDMTEQRNLELQLRQSQKMEVIGQIAAGVAHDFNNLLTVIIGHAVLSLSRARLDAATTESLTQIERAGERAAALTKQLLAFSRKQVVQLRPLDPRTALCNMEKMLKRLVGKTVEIQYDLADSLPAILADESCFEQVLLNLVVNARDAMPSGGTVLVSVDPVEVDPEEAIRNPDAHPGQFVRITVKDDGVGMDSETMRRIFDPFFTTKPAGKGTGLGLSTVYGIVKQHDGWVEVESNIGQGAVFRVYFPVTDGTVVESSSFESEIQETPTLSATVLVVEDEPQVREFICTALRSNGLKVLDAECVKSALGVWNAFGDEVDLLLADMILPNGLSGKSLAKILKAQNPDLRVIFTSGYGVDENRLAEGERRGKFHYLHYLQKPFGKGDLLRMIQTALNQAPAPL